MSIREKTKIAQKEQSKQKQLQEKNQAKAT
jgi:hypothetical protein